MASKLSKIQIRRGTTAEWENSDPVLAAGEPGLDLDTGKLRIGDGTSAWTELEDINAETGGESGGGAEVDRYRLIEVDLVMMNDDPEITSAEDLGLNYGGQRVAFPGWYSTPGFPETPGIYDIGEDGSLTLVEGTQPPFDFDFILRSKQRSDFGDDLSPFLTQIYLDEGGYYPKLSEWGWSDMRKLSDSIWFTEHLYNLGEGEDWAQSDKNLTAFMRGVDRFAGDVKSGEIGGAETLQVSVLVLENVNWMDFDLSGWDLDNLPGNEEGVLIWFAGQDYSWENGIYYRTHEETVFIGRHQGTDPIPKGGVNVLYVSKDGSSIDSWGFKIEPSDSAIPLDLNTAAQIYSSGGFGISGLNASSLHVPYDPTNYTGVATNSIGASSVTGHLKGIDVLLGALASNVGGGGDNQFIINADYVLMTDSGWGEVGPDWNDMEWLEQGDVVFIAYSSPHFDIGLYTLDGSNLIQLKPISDLVGRVVGVRGVVYLPGENPAASMLQPSPIDIIVTGTVSDSGLDFATFRTFNLSADSVLIDLGSDTVPVSDAVRSLTSADGFYAAGDELGLEVTNIEPVSDTLLAETAVYVKGVWPRRTRLQELKVYVETPVVGGVIHAYACEPTSSDGYYPRDPISLGVIDCSSSGWRSITPDVDLNAYSWIKLIANEDIEMKCLAPGAGRVIAQEPDGFSMACALTDGSTTAFPEWTAGFDCSPYYGPVPHVRMKVD